MNIFTWHQLLFTSNIFLLFGYCCNLARMHHVFDSINVGFRRNTYIRSHHIYIKTNESSSQSHSGKHLCNPSVIMIWNDVQNPIIIIASIWWLHHHPVDRVSSCAAYNHPESPQLSMHTYHDHERGTTGVFTMTIAVMMRRAAIYSDFARDDDARFRLWFIYKIYNNNSNDYDWKRRQHTRARATSAAH